jgi:hypothetical protein
MTSGGNARIWSPLRTAELSAWRQLEGLALHGAFPLGWLEDLLQTACGGSARVIR